MQKDVAEVVHRLLDLLAEALARGERVDLRNFGVFEVRFRRARVGRNPRKPTVPVVIPAHPTVKFVAGKKLGNRVAPLGCATLCQAVKGWG